MVSTETPAARVERTDSRLAPAVVWSYAITTGGYAITALLTFVLAAILSPREFGVLAMAMVWVSLAQMLLQHGPTMAVVQQDDITEDHVNAAFWSTMGGALVFSGLFALAAPLWAALNRLPELVPVCLALTPIVLIQATSVIPDAVLRRRMQMRGIAIRALTSAVVGGGAGVACAIAGMGVWSLVVQQVTTAAIYSAMLWVVNPWRPRIGPIRRPLREIGRTSLQTLAGSLGYFASARADILLSGAFFGPVVVGLYRFAARFAEMVVDLSARGLQFVSLPHLARHSADPEALGARLGRLVHATAALGFPALGVVAAVAEPLTLVIGTQWEQAAGPLRVLCMVSAVGMVVSLIGPAVQAAQRPGISASFTWISAAFSAGAIYLSARIAASDDTVGKLMALAWATLVGQVLVAAAFGYVAFARVLGVSARPVVTAALPGTIAGLSAAFTGALIHRLVDPGTGVLATLLITMTIATAVAACVLLVLDREVRRQLRRVRAPLRRWRG